MPPSWRLALREPAHPSGQIAGICRLTIAVEPNPKGACQLHNGVMPWRCAISRKKSPRFKVPVSCPGRGTGRR